MALTRFILLRVLLPLLAVAATYVAVRYGMTALGKEDRWADLTAAILAVVVAMAAFGGEVARAGIGGHGFHGVGVGGDGVSDVGGTDGCGGDSGSCS